MRLSTRKNEVDAVIRLMESEEFDSPEALAKAIVVQVAEELSHRDNMQGIAVKFPNEDRYVLAVGPFYHSDDLKKWCEEAQEAGLETRIAPLSSPDCLAPAQAVTSGFCVCGHKKEQHVRYGKKDKEGPPRDCGVCAKGQCNQFTQEKKSE